MFVPISKDGGVTTFVVEDPFDLAKVDYVKTLGLSPNYDFWVGLSADIIECIKASYQIEGNAADSMGSILEQLTDMASGEVLEEEEEEAELEEESVSKPL